MLRIAEQFAGSDTGRQRRGNEDAYLEQAPLFVVADGMGGAQGGEVASKIAIDLFAGGFDVGEGGDPASELAERAVAANAKIFARANDQAELAGMGTTLTAAYVGPTEVSFAHVGDSRAYRFHDGKLERLTQDHSLVEEMIRQGQPHRGGGGGASAAIDHHARARPRARRRRRHLHAQRRGRRHLPVCSDGLTSMVLR